VLHQRFRLLHPPEIAAGPGVRGQATRFTKRAVRKVTSWYVEPRWVAQTDFDSATAWAATDAVTALEQLQNQVHQLSQAIDDTRRTLEGSTAEQAYLRADVQGLSESVHDRHDGELNSLRYDVADLNVAIGTVAARVETVRRQLVAAGAFADRPPAPMPDAFLVPEVDYTAFEDRFRGTRADVTEGQRAYLPLFGDPAEHPRVIDLGCGRGEMLKLLEEHGFEPVGIETDTNMLDACRDQDLNVVEADAILWLQSVDGDTLDGIFSAQVIEHLPVGALLSLVGAARRALRRGGVMVLETIDPRSMFALCNWFYADLSHIRPVYPPTLAYLCEEAGFTSVEIMSRSPHPAMQMVDGLPDDVQGRAVKQLVETVFGYQDYAVIARK
jgi:SAM-dependent methyltransferase